MLEVVLDDRLGKKVRVKCNEDDTIGDLKKLAAAQLGTRPEKLVIKKWYTVYKVCSASIVLVFLVCAILTLTVHRIISHWTTTKSTTAWAWNCKSVERVEISPLNCNHECVTVILHGEFTTTFSSCALLQVLSMRC